MIVLYQVSLFSLKQGTFLNLSQKPERLGFGVALFALMIMTRACLFVIFAEFFVIL